MQSPAGIKGWPTVFDCYQLAARLIGSTNVS